MNINKLYQIRKSYILYFPPFDQINKEQIFYAKNHLQYIKGMKKVLTKFGFECICKKYIPESFTSSFKDSDIAKLENRINSSIEKAISNKLKNYDLVEEVFHAIQLWGGIHGRWIYQTGSFKDNFDIDLYIRFCKFYFNNHQLVDDHVNNIQSLCNMSSINIPFATRHAKFWSASNKNKVSSLIPCIFDQSIREMITGEFGGPNTKRKKNLHELNALWLIQEYICKQYRINSNRFDLIMRHYSSDLINIDYSTFLKFKVLNTGEINKID